MAGYTDIEYKIEGMSKWRDPGQPKDKNLEEMTETVRLILKTYQTENSNLPQKLKY